MDEWLPYPWQRSIGRKGTCALCKKDVTGEDIVACLHKQNWCHEICALRAYMFVVREPSVRDVIVSDTREGTEAELMAAVKANAIPGITYDYGRRRDRRCTWLERKQ